MVCKNSVIYEFLGPSWVLITIPLRKIVPADNQRKRHFESIVIDERKKLSIILGTRYKARYTDYTYSYTPEYIRYIYIPGNIQVQKRVTQEEQNFKCVLPFWFYIYTSKYIIYKYLVYYILRVYIIYIFTCTLCGSFFIYIFLPALCVGVFLRNTCVTSRPSN